MFVGHFGVGFAGKAAAPRASLGTSLPAARFVDLLFARAWRVGRYRTLSDPTAAAA